MKTKLISKILDLKKMKLNTKYFKPVMLLLVALIIGSVIFYTINHQTPQRKKAVMPTLSQFITDIKIPSAEATGSALITKKFDNYEVAAATSSAVSKAITFKTKSQSVSFTPLDNRTLGAANLSQAKSDGKNTITYPNIYNGINLIYTTSPDKILEEYEVKNKRQINEIIQKIDMTGLEYQKQADGSILFYKVNDPAKKLVMAIPKPVMYESGDHRKRSYGLHYEFMEDKGNTFLVKVIDPAGKDWLNQSSYPVMIDGTIVLTLFGYESYTIVDNTWQIRLDTVASGDLVVKPGSGTSWTDVQFETLTCGTTPITPERDPKTNNLTIKNFSCSDLALLTTKVSDPTKSYSLIFEYGSSDNGTPYKTTVTSDKYTGKPVILSASVNPPTPKVGDQITVKAEVIDQAGIKEVKANMADIETITLNLISGTSTHGFYEGIWTVKETTFKQYPVTLIATNNQELSTINQITIFDAYTCLGGGDHGGSDWTPVGECAGNEIAGVHTNIGTFNVGIGTTATVKAYDGANYGTFEVQAVTVNILGIIAADAKGYRGGSSGTGSSGEGPGGGWGNPDTGWGQAGGAGYGGVGKSQSGYGSVYDSAELPTYMGSGGGGTTSYTGPSGGGIIKIIASGSFTAAGIISANGGNGGGGCQHTGGAAGGSIVLSAASFDATGGVIRANGGAAAGDGCGGSGAGGGGRINIKYASTYTAPTTLTTTSGGSGAGNGTVAIIDTYNNDLYIKSSQTWKSDPAIDGSTHNYHAIFVQNNATWTLPGYYTNNYDGVGFIFNVVDFSIESGSVLSADGGGYAGGQASGTKNGSGPGGGLEGCTGGVRGGGGGYGGIGSIPGVLGGLRYGSITNPIDLGSGGAAGTWGGCANGATGGGAIKIIASGTTTIDGTIKATGNTIPSWNGGGGGSGGSVNITADIVAGINGSALISANGGNGDADRSGAGGRIAVKYNTKTYSGTYQANAGSSNAQSGTIYLLDTSANDLYITSTQTWTATADSDSRNLTYHNVYVQNNAIWTLIGYSSNNTDGVGYVFNVDNLEITAGSAMVANAGGYSGGNSTTTAGSGPGGGGAATQGGGGGYGGAGGSSGGAAGGSSYGLASNPIYLGSGGGGLAGGNGGGAIKILATDTVTVSGTLSANGGNGGGGCSHGGGGSGGSIYVFADTITANGSIITANGGSNAGDGCGSSAGGGGGRIALYYLTDYTAPTTLTANGSSASNGTVNVAVIRTWDGGGTDETCGGSAGDGNKWSCAANWTDDTVPGSSDIAAFDATSTKNATVDASFGGTVTGLMINSGYTGTITQSRSLTISVDYIQADGTLNGNDQALTVTGSFSQSGGVFTQGEVTDNSLTSGLVAYWAMDETIGNTAADSIGGNTLTGTNTPTIVDGKISKGRNFVSTGSQYMTSGSNVGISGTAPRSVSLWFKPAATQGQQTLFNWGTASNNALFGLLYDYTDEGLYFFGYNNDQAGHTNTITRSAWNHVVVIYDSTYIKVYINGNTIPDINVSKTNLNTTNSVLTIGKRLDSNYYYSGAIDDLRIYNRVLNTREIMTLNGGETTSLNPSLNINSNFTLSSGTFNGVSSQIMSVAGNLNISGGTLTPNSNIIDIDGSSASTLTCNNVTFNKVNIYKSTNTAAVIIGSDCTLPLGASPVATGIFTSSGTLSGTGTLTLNTATASTNTFNTGSSLSGFSALTAYGNFTIAGGTINLGSFTSATFNNAFTISSGSFTAPSANNATFTGTFTQSGGTFSGSAGTLDFNNTVTLSGGTFTATSGITTVAGSFTASGGIVFNHNSGIFTFDSSTGSVTLACGGITFNQVNISKSTSGTTLTVGNGCNIPLGNSPNSTGAITNNGTIVTGSGTWTITGSYTNANGSTLTMGGTGLTISNNLTITTGTFPSNLTLTLNTGSTSTVTCTIPVTFGSIVFSKTSSTIGVTIGANCTAPLGNSPNSTGAITNNGTMTMGTGTWTLTGSYTQNNGASLSSTGTGLTVSDNLTVNGGTFPSNFDLILTGGNNSTITGTITFNSMTVNKSGGTTAFNGNLTTGNFTRTDGVVGNSNAIYTLTIGGNLNISTADAFGGANLTIKLDGSGTQTIANNNTATFSSPFKINKSGGSASLSTNLTTTTQNCTVEEGTFDINGKVFTCGGTFTVEDGGNLQMVGSESPTTPTLNTGSTVTYVGDGDAAADTYKFKGWTYSNLIVNFMDASDILDPSGTVAPSSGLVAHWAMDESSGTTMVADSSGNNYDATSISSTNVTGGRINNARSFVGNSSTYITGPTINLPAPITVSAWVYSTNYNANMFVVEKTPVNGEWEMFFEGSLRWRGGSTASVGCTAPSNSNWHHLVATQTGTSAQLFIDGTSCNSGSVTAIPNGNGTIQIGRHEASGYYFNGTIDDVRIYDHVLTTDEIILLYNYTGDSVTSLTVNGNLTISQGIFTSPATLNIGGNFTNSGVFNHNSGQVNLTGGGTGNQTIDGTTATTTFYNLYATATGGSRTIYFKDGNHYAIAANGTLSLQGTASNTLTVTSQTSSDHWLLDVNNTGTTVAVSYVNASWSDTSGGKQIDASNGTNINGGNNENWLFSGGGGGGSSIFNFNLENLNLNGINLN